MPKHQQNAQTPSDMPHTVTPFRQTLSGTPRKLTRDSKWNHHRDTYIEFVQGHDFINRRKGADFDGLVRQRELHAHRGYNIGVFLGTYRSHLDKKTKVATMVEL